MVATLGLTVTMIVLNVIYAVPLFARFAGFDIYKTYGLSKYLLTMIVPFNLLEGVIWAVVFWLIYKLLQPVLKRYENKQSYLTKGSFALLLFVMLGYMVKFYPEQLTSLTSDSDLATGDLPAALTTFFKLVTSVIDPMGIIIWVSALVLFSFTKNGSWKLPC